MLTVERLEVRYGGIHAIKGVSLSIARGQIATMLGANGAGKTTTLRTISGLVKASRGTIRFEDVELTNRPPHEIVALGVGQAPEGRMIFANLTVKENLEMGAYLRKNRAEIQNDLDFVFSIFPRLRERIKQPGGTLSGGEQQMLAIGRALMTRPRLLLLDEPSLGIAPILVKTIFEKIQEINRELGMTILLVVETGELMIEGKASEIAKNEGVRKAYLGET
ncbi:MAG: ABC transporter ATP-binding protein [Ignavibacteria bacterium]|nr:MAG: ABC transporter ATP-binding protein [Ignavibacteria bacterium]